MCGTQCLISIKFHCSAQLRMLHLFNYIYIYTPCVDSLLLLHDHSSHDIYIVEPVIMIEQRNIQNTN